MEKFPCPHCSAYPSLTECHYMPGGPGFPNTTDFVAVTRYGMARVNWANKIRVESEFVDPKATTCPGCNKALTEEEVTNPRLNHALEILLKDEEVSLQVAESFHKHGFCVQLVGVPEKKWHPDDQYDPVRTMLKYRMYHDCGMGHIENDGRGGLFGSPKNYDSITFQCTGCNKEVEVSVETLEVPLRRLFLTLNWVGGISCHYDRLIAFSFIEKAPY